MTKKTVIVIFGCRHQEEFLGRTNAAIHFAARNNINPIFIFIGCDSPPPKEVIDLFESDQIIWESVSRDTQENTRNALEEVRRHRLDELPVYFVSSWYHVPRIRFFLKREGINFSKFSFVSSYGSIRLINILIEPFAFFATFFKFNRHPFIKRIRRSLGYI